VVTTLVLAAAIVQATVYRIDPAACEAGFDLKATAHTVHGSTTSVTGEVGVTPDEAGVLTFSGKISVGAASLDTGNERRDATLHSKSLLVASFPSIDLAPLRFTPSGPPGADGTIPGALTGRLTIRGQTRPQTIAVTLRPHDGRIEAMGTFDVAWPEFGVPDPSFFVVRVDKVAHARFRAEFVPLP
jgi:polyisoprenoid-binding protein YceI